MVALCAEIAAEIMRILMFANKVGLQRNIDYCICKFLGIRFLKWHIFRLLEDFSENISVLRFFDQAENQKAQKSCLFYQIEAPKQPLIYWLKYVFQDGDDVNDTADVGLRGKMKRIIRLEWWFYPFTTFVCGFSSFILHAFAVGMAGKIMKGIKYYST